MKSLFVFYLKNYKLIHFFVLCLLCIPICIGVGHILKIEYLFILIFDWIIMWFINKPLLDKSGVTSEVNKFKRDFNIQ